MSQAYRTLYIDKEAGSKSAGFIRKQAQATFRDEILSDFFAGGSVFSLAAAKKMDDPILVSSIGGIDAKLKVAFLMDKHDTVGIDCVAMCVNDIICSGAEPLFFSDYISCSRNYSSLTNIIISGIIEGCLLSDISLIGGKTSEIPGFYQNREYDLAGFAVGLADRSKCIGSRNVKVGDALIGLGSSGVHCSGFSLIRQVLRLNERCLMEYVQSLGSTLGDELIKPTRIYTRSISKLKDIIPINAIYHIKNGGIAKSIRRMLPEGCGAVIRCGTWEELPVFKLIQWEGEIDSTEMYNIFNMGIGMIIAVSPEHVNAALTQLKELGEKAFVIGEICDSDLCDEANVIFC